MIVRGPDLTPKRTGRARQSPHLPPNPRAFDSTRFLHPGMQQDPQCPHVRVRPQNLSRKEAHGREFCGLRPSRYRRLLCSTSLRPRCVWKIGWDIIQALLVAFISGFFLCRAVLPNNRGNLPSAPALHDVDAFADSDSDGQEKSDAETLANVNWWGREE